jgi:hypothetical protein
MKAMAHLLLALVGVALTARGVRLATTRPRPHNLLGMVLATVGMALALGSLATGIWWLGR